MQRDVVGVGGPGGGVDTRVSMCALERMRDALCLCLLCVVWCVLMCRHLRRHSPIIRLAPLGRITKSDGVSHLYQ